MDVRRDRARVLVLAVHARLGCAFSGASGRQRERRLALSVVPIRRARGLVLADSLTPWQPPTTAAGWRNWDAVVLTGWLGADARLDWAALATAVDDGLGPAGAAVGDGVAGGHSDRRGSARTAGGIAAGRNGAVALGIRTALRGDRRQPVPDTRCSTGSPTCAGLGTGHFAAVAADRAHGRPRLGSTVLLEAATGVPDGEPALPALVVAGRGQGRVAWFGVRQVWEWVFWELPGGAPAGEGNRRGCCCATFWSGWRAAPSRPVWTLRYVRALPGR